MGRTLSHARTAGLLVLGVALAGCGSGAAATAGGSTTPKTGGTLTFAVGSDTGCTDPQQVASNDSIYSVRQLVDSLTDQDPETGEIVPWLAESWDVSDDAKTFTFHLRDGVTFSDGSELTAEVVKENFEAAPELGALAGLATGYLSGVEKITADDPRTVTVAFAQPNAQFLQATSTHSLGIVSGASTKLSAQERCTKGIVGSGPFTLAEYAANSSATLKKRTGYAWGSSLWEKQGEAYLDQIVFKVLPEAGVRTGSLQSGQVDAIGNVGRADESALEAAGVTLPARANPGVVFNLAANNSDPILKDAAVRQAIGLAIDRQQVADTVFNTGTQPATSVLAHTTPGYEDLSAALTFDLDAAKALLDAEGWKAGADGVRTRGSEQLRFTISWFANSPTNQPSLELIQQQLRRAGIAVELKQNEISQFATLLASGDYDLIWGNVTRADPDILRSQFSTALSNPYRLSASELDGTLTEQAGTIDPAAREKLVATAQETIVREAYTVPVVELQTKLGVAKRVHALNFEASSRIQLHDTWVE
ncbi:ABC transporter substrate-binding protein [Kineosporia succinea]|uniref:Peptide/nickel transport system substrate-binding protein n=1 Tax=Kineosporia succinea TaxID=84632 RepID=A0ABT9P8U2_9ACTN|nr:ABC transporter substrate-binding protein [Kineosporia succinea]MDP9829103.1 peptide/nickel transport system substrate-binding protein [Kineosporia succinea]